MMHREGRTKMATKKSFVDALVKDPSKLPNHSSVTGWVGSSDKEKVTRLYTDVNLSSFIEVPNDIIEHKEEIKSEIIDQKKSILWIDNRNIEKLNIGGATPLSPFPLPTSPFPLPTQFGPCGGTGFGPGCSPPTQGPPCPPLTTVGPGCGTTFGPGCGTTFGPGCGTGFGPGCPPITQGPPCPQITQVPPCLSQTVIGPGCGTAFGPGCQINTLVGPGCNLGPSIV